MKTLHENEAEDALSVLISHSDIDMDVVDQIADYLISGDGDKDLMRRQLKRIRNEADDYSDGQNTDRIVDACGVLLHAIMR